MKTFGCDGVAARVLNVLLTKESGFFRVLFSDWKLLSQTSLFRLEKMTPDRISSALYLVGCSFLIPATILLYFASLARESISFFIAATGTLTVAAILDTGALIVEMKRKKKTDGEMQPLVVNDAAKNANARRDALFTVIVVKSALAGGILFLAGAIMFWPTLGVSKQGLWVFRFGSVAYFVGNIFLLPLIIPTGKRIHIAGTIIYMAGSIAYITGDAQCAKDFAARILLTCKCFQVVLSKSVALQPCTPQVSGWAAEFSFSWELCVEF